MKKIEFFISFILAFLSILPVYPQSQEFIALDLSKEGTFFDTVLDEEEDDDDPVKNVSDKSIYKKKQGPLIDAQKAPEAQKNMSIEEAEHGFFLYNILAKTAKDIYNLEIEKTNVPSQLLKDQLTFNFEKGPLESLHLWSAYQMNFSTQIPEKGDTDSNFNVGLINILIDGKFKGGKENFRIMLDPTHRENVPFMGPFFQDLYVETHRVKNTSILVGNSRTGVGIEGTQSPYTLSFVNRSQIARNLSNIRKFGLRVRGDYSLVDYDVGVYSSSTNFTSFFPGHEVNAWTNIKPLGKTDGRYGKLVAGGGLSSGEKHNMSYFVSGAYLGYDYKKFWTKLEYAQADGSNGGTGLTDKKSQGFFATIGYRLTKKIELLARYDVFDADRHKAGDKRTEYTLGTNYYLKGQALKLIFNYIFCQNQDRPDSHRLMVGTQILL